MTSGSFDTGGGYPTVLPRERKRKHGEDGKYETVNGRTRVRWNRFSLNYYVQTAQTGQLTNKVGDLLDGTPEWPAAEEFSLQSKLVKKVKGHQLNLAVSTAEGIRTVSLCTNTIRKMAAALTLVKRGRFGDALRQLGAVKKKSQKDVTSPRLKPADLTSTWLEAQYGWAPLLSDCYEATSAYARLTGQRRTRVRVKHKYIQEGNFAASPSLYGYVGNHTTVTYLTYEMEEELSADRSLGLRDPYSLAWELLPYSFVFDWFLPIGTYLENLNVIPTLKGRFLTTRVAEYTAEFAEDYTTNGAYTPTQRATYGKGVERLSPVNGLSTQTPRFVSLPAAMSPKRIFSAVSLAHQAVLRSPIFR